LYYQGSGGSRPLTTSFLFVRFTAAGIVAQTNPACKDGACIPIPRVNSLVQIILSLSPEEQSLLYPENITGLL